MEDEEAHQILEHIEHAEKELLELIRIPMSTPANVGYQHMYLFGIANRALSQSSSFRMMIEEGNSLVASSILRMQLDTVLRLYALFWVKDAEYFAREVWNGVQIDRLKSSDGNLMKDKYLIGRLLPKNPWISEVYKQTSGFVHFSNRHIHAVVHFKDEEFTNATLAIGKKDFNKPLGYYGELLHAFRHVNMMLPVACEDWFSRINNNNSSVNFGSILKPTKN